MVRLVVTISLLGMLAGCGGGSDAAPSPAPTAVTVSGRVTFDFVPAVAGQGLNYAATVTRPARGVTVELLQNGAVTASTPTDVLGDYSFASVPVATDVALRVRAEMLRVGTPSWDFRVVDNVNGDALYTLAGTTFNTGSRERHSQSACRVRLDGLRVYRDAFGRAVRDTRHRLRCRAAHPHRGARLRCSRPCSCTGARPTCPLQAPRPVRSARAATDSAPESSS